MALDDCAPCSCDPAQFARTEQGFQTTAVRILCQILTALGGGSTPWAYNPVNIAYTAETGVGATPADAYSVSIANVGVAAGTVEGVAFPAGATINFSTITDEVTREVRRVPAISFDATGTTFNIAVES